jgi:hypothetical protein
VAFFAFDAHVIGLAVEPTMRQTVGYAHIMILFMVIVPVVLALIFSYIGSFFEEKPKAKSSTGT